MNIQKPSAAASSGSKIFIYDEFAPQDTAMMQALYSRSAKSVEEHAEKVKKSGSGSFMERYYVGYGHASIADCGSTTIFIEGVSTLAAKAIQDWPLYSGQETSSRYIDMSKQRIEDPVGSRDSKKIIDDWMKFYVTAQEDVATHIRVQYPKQEGEDQGVYDRAVNARVFDILRGFLPAGITTQLSWHTNLRQAYDKLALLVHHPLVEVAAVGRNILDSLKVKYPQSFGHKTYPLQEEYRAFSGKEVTYYSGARMSKDFVGSTTIKEADLKPYARLLKKRPVKTNLPYQLAEIGNISFEFLLDFGSFRDVQRHRNGVCRMPKLGTSLGFHEWYVSQLPAKRQAEARKLIQVQKARIKALKCDPLIKQYYCAMGFLVQCKVTYGLPAAIYVMELRSGKTVHPTLRHAALKMYECMHKRWPTMTLHPDLSKDDWDIRRGMQDIKEK